MSINFNSLQKKAILKVLIDIIYADAKVAIGEALYMNQIKEDLNVTDSDLQEAVKMGTIASVLVLKELTDDQKKEFIKMMTKMSSADGTVHPIELQLVYLVIDAINIK